MGLKKLNVENLVTLHLLLLRSILCTYSTVPSIFIFIFLLHCRIVVCTRNVAGPALVTGSARGKVGQPLARKLVLTPHHPLILHTQPVRTLETNICPGHHTFTLVSSWNRNVCRFLVFIKHCRVE